MIYGEKTSPVIGALASETIALVPIAAVEQHGNHLPVITDTALVSEVARRAEAALGDKVALLPTLWIGCSHHHLGFPGTISLQSETYIRVLEDIAECLLKAGFRKIVFLNGHGGNVVPLSEALYRLSLRRPENDAPWIIGATYWRLGEPEISEQTFMESLRLTHACEYETSMMLGLRVDWVDMALAEGRNVMRKSKYYDPMGTSPSRVAVSETFAQMTDIGAMGSPELATPEKGEKLFELFSTSLRHFLEEFSGWSHERN